MTWFVGTEYQTEVEWRDTDASGHHHNSAVIRFVEAAEAQLMRDRHVTGYFGRAPRAHLEVDYESTLVFQQQVTVLLVLERIGTASMTFGFEVWGEAFEGHPRSRAAVGRYVTVHVPTDGGGSRPWPLEWVAALGHTMQRPTAASPPVCEF